MGVRTRGLDMRAGFKRDAADKAARADAESVIQRWKEQLAYRALDLADYVHHLGDIRLFVRRLPSVLSP